jgi:hypothetical protein
MAVSLVGPLRSRGYCFSPLFSVTSTDLGTFAAVTVLLTGVVFLRAICRRGGHRESIPS